MDILFCGAGKMATAIAGGIGAKNLFPGDRIVAADPPHHPCVPEPCPELFE